MTNSHQNCIRLLALAVALGLVPDAPGQNNPRPDRLIIQLRPGNQPAQVAAAHGLAPGHVYTHVVHGFAAHVPPARLAALVNDRRVARITVDHQVFAFAQAAARRPPPTSKQVLPAGVVRVGARLVGQTGAGIGVAVLDTGLDFAHQDLRISPRFFVSPGFTYTSSAQDDVGHGTHVGGIVAAKDNSVAVVGVASGGTLYAVKVLDNNGTGYDSDIISGLNWVVANATTVTPRIRVINLSLGRLASDDDSLMHAAINDAVNAGITVVAAAGNDSTKEVSQMVPAGFPAVIAVASTTAKSGTSNRKRVAPVAADTASYFTTDGKFNVLTGMGVAISAPGEEREDISYPYLNSLGILSTALGGGTSRMTGTSMAAPHAAGVVALLLEKMPALTPAAIKMRLMGGDRVGIAPLNSPAATYTFDGDREGILYAPKVLAP